MMNTKTGKLIVFLIAGAALLLLPIGIYALLAMGLNIVVGYAGLLDLGYVAFYAVGAYMFGLLASPHLTDTFPAIKAMFATGLHLPIWVVIPLGAAVAGTFGMLLGAPTLKLLAVAPGRPRVDHHDAGSGGDEAGVDDVAAIGH